MSNLGELFRQIRVAKNWSIREAAKKMGISYSYLSVLEKGIDPRTGKYANPKPDTLRIISKTYEYPYEELMRAAGYLDDEVTYDRKFDLTVFISNINLLMGDMSIEEFSKDIYDKTGYNISPKQIRSYLNGDIEPFPGTMNILSKYAKVTLDFWYRFNNSETLAEERKKYQEQLLKDVEEDSNGSMIIANLPRNVRNWLVSEESIPYVEAAMEAYNKKINPNSLKLVIESIAAAKEDDKRQI